MAHICEYGSLLQGYRTFLNTYHPSIYLFRKHRLHIWKDEGAGRAVRDGPDNLGCTEKHGYNLLGLVLRAGNPNYLEG